MTKAGSLTTRRSENGACTTPKASWSKRPGINPTPENYSSRCPERERSVVIVLKIRITGIQFHPGLHEPDRNEKQNNGSKMPETRVRFAEIAARRAGGSDGQWAFESRSARQTFRLVSR